MSAHPTLGRILRDLRSHRGWTLKEMSQRCGIPLSKLSTSSGRHLELQANGPLKAVRVPAPPHRRPMQEHSSA